MEKGLPAKTATKGPLDGLFSAPKDNGEGKNPFGSATPLAFSPASVRKTTQELVSQKSDLEAYNEQQHLELIRLQNLLLEGITEEKIEAASLSEITKAFATLKDKQLVMTGKATSITGIVGYLIQLEKEEFEGKNPPITVNEVELSAGDFSLEVQDETILEEEEDPLPRL